MKHNLALVGTPIVIMLTLFCSFSIVHSARAIGYTIEYKENVATNMPESVLNGLSPSASALLSNNTPLRTGYEFIGWCDQATTKSGANDTCASGHEFQPGGTYTLNATAANSITLRAMWGTPERERTTASGKIHYYANASNAVGTMGEQDVASSVELLASNYSRAGYGFAGWSNKFDYATNQDEDLKFYGPMETITIPDTSIYTGEGKGLSLYAVWVKSAGSLQDSEKVAELCGTGNSALDTAPTDGTANLDSVSALTDSRDNQTYAIAKLADGKCWMIENLRLDNTAEHNSDGTLAQGYHSSFAGLANAESANFSNSTTANSLYSTDGSTTKTIDSTGDYLGYRFPRYNNTNTSARASSPTTNSGNMYSYGNYYTWHAAMANTTHYGGPTATDADSKTSETVNTSLCPTGWRLPYGRSSGNGAITGGFYNLNYKINNDSNVTDSTASLKLRSFPNNFLYSGSFNNSSASDRGSYGNYWSSTATSVNSSYFLYLNSSNVYPTSSSIKSYGRSVRCVSGS